MIGRTALSSAIGAASVAFGVVAASAEQVVLPYRCEAFGHDISLTPSEARAYQIYGQREQDLVTACAPDDPNRCRTWRVHRFEMNCGGARVPWIDVVAAANAMNRGPATRRGSRLYVRMDPWWARHRPPAWAERPKLREFEPGEFGPDRFRPRPQEYGYAPAQRAPSVEMPAGFAPIVGMSARFEGGGAPGMGATADRGFEQGFDDSRQGGIGASDSREPFDGRASPPPPNWQTAGRATSEKPPRPPTEARAGSAVPAPLTKDPKDKVTASQSATAQPSAPVKTALNDSGHTFAPKAEDAAKAAAANKEPAAASKPVDVKTAEAKATDDKPAVPQPVEATPSAPPPTPADKTAAVAPPGTAVPAAPEPTINSVAPTILNRPGAETTAITSATSSAGDKVGAEAAPLQSMMPATIETSSNPVPLASSPAKSWPIVFGITAIALLSAALAYFMRRRSDAGAQPVPAERDLSSVSLDATRSKALVRTGTTLTADPTHPPKRPHTFIRPQLSEPQLPEPVFAPDFVPGPILEPDWLPSTREEALHVLGAGPDASEAVLKKIVDGLRMSWHPDHSKSAEDHRMRSERMTQINVAWDILSGRQA